MVQLRIFACISRNSTVTRAWLKHAIHPVWVAIMMMPGKSADNMTAPTMQATMSSYPMAAETAFA